MDVNSIVNGANSMNDYDSLSVAESSPETKYKEVESIPKEEHTSSDETKKDMNKKELEDAVNKLNKLLEHEKTHAEYSVHKVFKTIMIKIVNDDTKKVVAEFPPEKILDMVAKMCERDGLFDKKA